MLHTKFHSNRFSHLLVKLKQRCTQKSWFYIGLYCVNLWNMFGISGSLISSKTLMELIVKLCGEFRWSPEGPVSQIHSPHLQAGAPGIFSHLLRFVQMLKREWGTESNGKRPHLFIPSKTATLFPEFAVEYLLQNCSLGAWVCSGKKPALGQNTVMTILGQNEKWIALECTGFVRLNLETLRILRDLNSSLKKKCINGGSYKKTSILMRRHMFY